MAIQTLKLGELISTIISKINMNFSEIATSIATIPTKLSQLENDANYVKTTDAAFTNKVDAVEGKGLSTNDYTTAEKNKLAGLHAPVNISFTASDFTASGSQYTYTAALNGCYPVAVMRDGEMCLCDIEVSGTNVVITVDETFAGVIVTV